MVENDAQCVYAMYMADIRDPYARHVLATSSLSSSWVRKLSGTVHMSPVAIRTPKTSATTPFRLLKDSTALLV